MKIDQELVGRLSVKDVQDGFAAQQNVFEGLADEELEKAVVAREDALQRNYDNGVKELGRIFGQMQATKQVLNKLIHERRIALSKAVFFSEYESLSDDDKALVDRLIKAAKQNEPS